MMLSAVVLAKNEEKNIQRCLKSLSDLANEIIVIDDNSSDKTPEIAKSLGASVLKRDLHQDFSGQRNFGLEKAKGEWVFFIDADEVVTKELQREIVTLLNYYIANKKKGHCFYIKRRDYFWGRELRFGETQKVRNQGLMRLVKKNSGKWMGIVHEEFRTQEKTRKAQAFLNHYPHQTVKEFLEDVNYYSTLRARELYKNQKKTNIFEIVLFPFGKFILNYFLKLGFMDGASGFVYAFFMSFHSFLVRAKLYQYWKIDRK